MPESKLIYRLPSTVLILCVLYTSGCGDSRVPPQYRDRFDSLEDIRETIADSQDVDRQLLAVEAMRIANHDWPVAKTTLIEIRENENATWRNRVGAVVELRLVGEFDYTESKDLLEEALRCEDDLAVLAALFELEAWIEEGENVEWAVPTLRTFVAEGRSSTTPTMHSSDQVIQVSKRILERVENRGEGTDAGNS